jgi:hypothetical protein
MGRLFLGKFVGEAARVIGLWEVFQQVGLWLVSAFESR